ncbi:PT domain-containing protein [Glutamicibacter mysorens]|uniref:PT domain-containing protein n=1 Tax=Glutamicibacter mysorens TaxID=257984 RepID=UPI0020C65A1E|nr:PT domain-containing protein [Glutamicibacter mysorens]UTM47897.1 PT domain-containing protein [Glutamicibacter mysorens]
MTAVNNGEENFKYNDATTDFKAGKIVLDTLPGLIKHGTPISGSASVFPNSGEAYDNVSVANDQVTITSDPNPNPTAPNEEGYITRQVNYGFNLESADRTYLGGAINKPADGLRLVTGSIEKLSGRPLIETGSASWKFDVPADFFSLTGATATISYYSKDPAAAETSGFVDLDVEDIALVNNQVVLKDSRLPQLTEGDGYFVRLNGANGKDYATSYVGLYDKSPEPTAEPTETSEPTTEPTVEPTETTEPTTEPTVEPTETTEPTEVPEAQDPESGDHVAPGEENLSYDSESSSVAEGTYIFNTNTHVNDGDVAVTYRTSPEAKPQIITGSVKDGKLTITADDSLASSLKDHNQLLVSVEDSNGHVISALIAGSNALSLDSKIVDSRLGVLLAETGQKELTFKIPNRFPQITDDNYDFELQYVTSDGKPTALNSVDFTVNDRSLVINDSRTPELTAGTYYLKETKKTTSGSEDDATSAKSRVAAEDSATVSTWFGLYDSAPEPTTEPTENPTVEPSEDPSNVPSDDPTSEPSDDESTPSQSATVTPSSSNHERETSEDENHKDDGLAETGASSGLPLAGGLALGLIAVGAIAISVRRRGRHG